MKVNKLSKRFGDQVLFKDLNLDLGEKGLVAFIGRSGSGKSTFLSLLSGNLKPDEGEVYYGNTSLQKCTLKELRLLRKNDFGFLYQNHNLLEEETAFENAAIPLRIQGLKESEIKKTLSPLFKTFNIEDLEDKPVSFLSGGEKARVSLIRVLAKKPNVIFADEPTGSLDKENTQIVMESLKKASQDSLVLLVTHETKYVREFADSYYDLEKQEGKITPIKSLKKKGDSQENKWWFLSLLKGKRMKNSTFFSTLGACFIAYLSLFITLSFQNSSQEILTEESRNTLLYSQASISKEHVISYENSPLSLIQSTRPNLDELKSYLPKEMQIKENFSFFFPPNTAFKVNGFPHQEASFYPIYDFSLKDGFENLLIAGDLPYAETFDYLIINEDFAEILPSNPFDQYIDISVSCGIEFEGIHDNFSFTKRFKIAAIIKEFPFLGVPRAYYSYQAFVSFLKEISLPNLSSLYKENINILSFLSFLPDDSPYHSDSWNLYAPTTDLRKTLFHLAKENNPFVVRSEAYELANGFSSLTNSFSSLCMPFVIFEILATMFIVAILLLSSFLKKRREAAILYGEGSSFLSLFLLYSSPGVLGSFFAFFLSLFLSLPVSFFLSSYLETQVGIGNLFRVPLTSYLGVPYFLPILSFFISLLLPMLSALFPLRISLRNNLSEELKEE